MEDLAFSVGQPGSLSRQDVTVLSCRQGTSSVKRIELSHLSMPVSVCIVEDHRGTRESLVALFNQPGRLHCRKAFSTAEEAIIGIPQEKPDVALVDVNLPGMSGIECVSKLKGLMPKLHILMLTRFEQSEMIFKALRAGANGYLLKKMPPGEIIQAVESVHAGGAPMSMQIARKVVEHFHQIETPVAETERLTKREEEVLALLSKGSFYKEISDTLGISLNTVREYVRRIYEKLHVQSRTEATMKFLGRSQRV